MVISEYITKQGYFKLNKKALSRSELIFIVAFSLFMLSTLYETTAWGVWSDAVQDKVLILTKLMRYGCYFLCIVKLLIDSYYERTRLLLFGIAIGILVIGYFGSHNTTLVLYSTMFLAVEDVASELIIKTAFVCQSAIFVFTVGLSQLGIIEDRIWEANIRPRHFAGFSWVTTSAILFLFMAFEYIYLKKGKLSIAEYAAGIGLSYWLYKLSDARMAFLVAIVVFTFFFLFGKLIERGRLTNAWRGLFIMVPFILAAVAIGFQYIYDPDNALLAKLNEFLTGRLKWGHAGIDEYGLKLFGNKIEWVGYDADWESGMKYNYVDSSYLQIALEYGIIVLAVILLLYALLIFTSIKNQKYYLCWLALIILVFCVTEPRLVKLAYNPFMLLAVTESSKYFLNRFGQKNRGTDNEETEIVNS